MTRATRKSSSAVVDTPDVPEIETPESETVDTPETVETSETPETETPVNRIPDALNVPVLSDFCERYLSVLDEITAYNKSVVAEKDSQWTAAKVLEKARALGRPEKDEDADKEILTLIEDYEKIVKAVADARTALVNKTAEKLGIQMSAVADRNPELEGPLKEKRKVAVEIGQQLATIAKLTTNNQASEAVTAFLDANQLPAVGRDQMRSFSADGSKSTPKYRVTITVQKNGETVLTEDGFTKTALALTKLHERGKAPKPEDFRKAWEAAGNTPENTVQPTVEFENLGFHYTITKK